MRDGYAYTKADILLDDLLPEDERPRTLFEDDTTKRDRRMGALDAINGRFATVLSMIGGTAPISTAFATRPFSARAT